MKFYLSILFLTTVIIYSINGQSTEWTRGQGTNKEYLLVINPLEDYIYNFEQSRNICQSFNGQLPQIKSEAENIAVHQLIKSGVNSVWLGAWNAYKEDNIYTGSKIYQWLDGTNLSESGVYTNWDSNE